MKYVPFVLKHLRRNWIRTTLTVLGMAACIFLFCTLRTVLQAMDDAREHGNVTRLVTRHAVSLVYNVPLPYEGQIAQVPGVKRVAITTWFGGSLPAKKEKADDKAKTSSGGPDFSNFFPNFAVEDEPFFAMHPEFKIPPEQMRAYLEDGRGCIIGREIAQQFKWKIGDTFHLESFIPPYRKKDGPFEFVVRGILEADKVKEPNADEKTMFFHYKYIYEGTGRQIAAGTYAIELQDASIAGRVSKAVDALFENSEAETKTESEAAFQADFLAMAGNLAMLLNSIGLAVIFTILLVTANTMSMAVRERRTEIAVLKTLGFTSGRVMGLILGEAVTIGALGGAIGLGLSASVISALPGVPGLGDMIRAFPNFGLHLKVTSQAVGVALSLALLAGLFPAFVAYRSKISDMLRQV
jgi:putative ABC transport system permease protein